MGVANGCSVRSHLGAQDLRDVLDRWGRWAAAGGRWTAIGAELDAPRVLARIDRKRHELTGIEGLPVSSAPSVTGEAGQCE